ncbi:MAG: biotin synthase BioB [Pirellulales bacterium]|nr:biotin synthase BioB [Pirellulales bacterium]
MISVKSQSSSMWFDLAYRVLEGHYPNHEEGLAVLRCPDEELLDLLAAAYRVRRRYFGNRVHLNYLINAKSGHCGEDCGYCSQSRVSTAPIEKYDLLEPEKILDGARAAAELKSRTYCIVISGRAPRDRELDVIAGVAPEIKRRYPLAVCVSPGLLTLEQAERLKRCGVDRINHNLNTSRRFYPRICSTHTYEERLETLRAVRRAGLEICSGGIIGMGEEEADVVDLALELGALAVEATPINFLIPIEGTPITEALRNNKQPSPPTPLPKGEGRRKRLNPRYCLKALCLFRFSNPHVELRIAAGREIHLGPLQPLGLFAANSIFISDYLTTKGQPPAADFEMIEALGFQAVIH